MQKSTIIKIDKVEHIAVDKIGSVLFNFRSERLVQEDLESEDFEQLKLSIEKQGILQPISVVANTNGTYSIIDGSRRLEAVRQLRHKEIKVFVLEGSQLQLIATAISQNINRLNLNTEEATNAIINAAKILYDGDITEQEIKEKAKQIHNNNVHNVDKDFKNLIERLGFSANHVYQLLQVRVQLSGKALDKANEIDLPFRHRVLLTKDILKITPEDKKPENKKTYDIKEQRQLDLIDQIKGEPLQRAQEKTTSSIEFIKKYKDLPDYDPDTQELEGHEISEYARRMEADKDLPDTVNSPVRNYMDMMVALHNFLRSSTGVTLTKGQAYYNVDKHIKTKASEDHRKEIIDTMIELDCKALRIELNNAGHVIDSFMKLINAKYPSDLDKYK